MLDKRQTRLEYLKKRKSLTKEYMLSASTQIFNNLINSKLYTNSNDIFTYVSYQNEVNTHEFIKQALLDGKNIYVPVINRETFTMNISQIENFDDLTPNYMGILEPSKNNIKLTNAKVLDLVLTPGLAFDQNGYRVGYGGGFYDKFYASLETNPVRVGIGYAYMLVAELDHDDNDETLDYFLCEDGFKKVGGN